MAPPPASSDTVVPPGDPTLPLPSPPPERALRSAKLAALHARLSLSSRIPLQALARALVDPSADAHPRFNNANLAFVGAALLQYHASEYLVARWPRIPMSISFAAMKAYAGIPVLYQIARSWGIEAAAAPGEEVDPGLLQFDPDNPTVGATRWGHVRAEAKELLKYKWRRGLSSRILYDDPFGDLVPKDPRTDEEVIQAAAAEAEADAASQDRQQKGLEVDDSRNVRTLTLQDAIEAAHANCVRAIIGAIYLYNGREATASFIRAHMLSRQLDLSSLFTFQHPERELARLCARENFDPPLARLLSETGRLSRTPVFVVGIYSGRDRLGEGVGPTLDAARTAAAIKTLKAWYLYSPGEDVAVPSDAFVTDEKTPWKPLHVDLGEVVS